MASIISKLHDMGFKFGIYSSAGTFTCARYPGSLGYETKDAELWASWGVSRHFHIYRFFLANFFLGGLSQV